MPGATGGWRAALQWEQARPPLRCRCQARACELRHGALPHACNASAPEPSRHRRPLPLPQVVRGTVKQVAKFGVFVQLDGSPGVTGGRRLGAVGMARVGASLRGCGRPPGCRHAVQTHGTHSRWAVPSHEWVSLPGLAHMSEVADEFVKDLAALFTPGQRELPRVAPACGRGLGGRCAEPQVALLPRVAATARAGELACLPMRPHPPCHAPRHAAPAGVVARVLKVDAPARRLSLGLKPSYFEDLRWGAWLNDRGGGLVDDHR